MFISHNLQSLTMYLAVVYILLEDCFSCLTFVKAYQGK